MDKDHYTQEFIDFRPQLVSYLYRLTTNLSGAEDLAQDTYLKVMDKLDTFEGRSSFKTWAFTIATNLLRDNQRVRKRWGADWMDKVRDAHLADTELMAAKADIVHNAPYGHFVMSEHVNYCFNCTVKTLLLDQQICLWLKEVYAFTVAEIIDITGLSEGKVKHAIADARSTLARVFTERCALINKEGVCSQCTGLNEIYNPQQDAQIEANRMKMVKQASDSSKERLLDLRLELAGDMNPLLGEGRDLHKHLIENSPRWAEPQG